MQSHHHALLTATAAILTAVAVPAAPITWSPAASTGGKADLIGGNVVIALSGGTSSPTVTAGGAGGTTDYAFTAANFTSLGVHTFVADAGGPTPRNRVEDNVYNPDTITSSGDGDFDTMISSVTDSWGSPAGVTAGTLTLNGLADGGNYTIQVFFNDQRDATDDRIMTYGDGEVAESTVDLAGGDLSAGVQPGHYGQYAVGSFTASGTSQELTMTAVGFGNIHFSAIVVTGPPAANVPPEFDLAAYLFEVEDGALPDTVVGTPTATDPDGGPGPLEFSITFGNDGNAFAIDSATGEITVVGTIDLGNQATYTLEVEVSDGEDSSLTTVWVDVVPPPAPPVVVTYAGSAIDQVNWVTEGYGSAGYLFANTDDNDAAAGDYKRGGVLYTSLETPAVGQTVLFTQLGTSLGPWDRQSDVGPISPAALNVELQNPDPDPEVPFKSGVLYNFGLANNTPSDLLTLTFDEAVPDGYRLGILVGATETQGSSASVGGTTGNLRDIPYQIAVDSVSTTTTQLALDVVPSPEWMTISPADVNTGVPRADWYFFDLTGIEAGGIVTISASRVFSGASHKFCPINGVVLSSLAVGAPDPVITGVSLSGNTFTIDFTGEPGITDWKVMAGTDLLSFPDDKTPASIPEGPAGVYQAQVDITGDPANYFMRIER